MASVVRYLDGDIATGGDGTTWETAYKTLAAFITAEACDLSAGGGVQLTLYWRGSAVESTAANFSGFTNGSSSNWLHIICTDPHSGVRNASKCRIEINTAYLPAVNNLPAYTLCYGLQTKASGNSAVGISVTNPNCRFVRCISYDCGADGFLVNNGVTGTVFEHCGGFHNIRNGFRNQATASFLNCSSANNGSYGFEAYGYIGITIKNCYAGGNTTADYYGVNAGWTKTTCYSSDGTQSTSVAALSTSSGGYFNNVTAGSEDLHIGSSSTLRGAGTDISDDALYDEDVDGEARPSGSAWDVGYDQYVAGNPWYAYAQM